MALLEVRNLVKSYGDKTVLDGVSFDHEVLRLRRRDALTSSINEMNLFDGEPHAWTPCKISAFRASARGRLQLDHFHRTRDHFYPTADREKVIERRLLLAWRTVNPIPRHLNLLQRTVVRDRGSL